MELGIDYECEECGNIYNEEDSTAHYEPEAFCTRECELKASKKENEEEIPE